MSFLDKAKELAEQGEKLAAEHQNVVTKVVNAGEKLADEKTGGKYNSQIAKAGDKAEALIEKPTS